MLVLQKKLGLDKVAVRLPKVGTLAGLAPDVTVRQALRVLPKVTKAKGEKRATVGFLQGCVQRVFFGDVNRATLDVLAAEGFEVHSLREPRCCGALQLHAGDDDGAHGAREGDDRGVRALRHRRDERGGLRLGDEGLRARAAPGGRRLGRARRGVLREGPRHLRAAHRVRAAGRAPPRRPRPRRLPRRLPPRPRPGRPGRSRGRCCARSPAWRSSSPGEWEICCGSAGVYNLLKPEPARELGKRKLENLRATGTDVIVAANPGCALQINSAATEEGAPLRILHPIEVLAASIAKRSLNA